jgi:hypothetical protein
MDDDASSENRRAIVSAVVGDVWADEIEILGPTLFAQIMDASASSAPDRSVFRRPVAGDHIDLMPVIEEIGKAIEVISAAATLY